MRGYQDVVDLRRRGQDFLVNDERPLLVQPSLPQIGHASHPPTTHYFLCCWPCAACDNSNTTANSAASTTSPSAQHAKTSGRRQATAAPQQQQPGSRRRQWGVPAEPNKAAAAERASPRGRVSRRHRRETKRRQVDPVQPAGHKEPGDRDADRRHHERSKGVHGARGRQADIWCYCAAVL